MTFLWLWETPSEWDKYPHRGVTRPETIGEWVRESEFHMAVWKGQRSQEWTNSCIQKTKQKLCSGEHSHLNRNWGYKKGMFTADAKKFNNWIICILQCESKVRLREQLYSSALLRLSWLNKYSDINILWPHKSCFLGHERNLLADGGLMRGGLEAAETVQLTAWIWRAKQRSKLKVKPCRELNLEGFCQWACSGICSHLAVNLIIIHQKKVSLLFYICTLICDHCTEISL